MRWTPLAAGWLWLSCAARAAADPSLGKIVLQLPYTHQFEFAGVYAAQEQGYFRDEGVEVEVRPNPYGKLPLVEVSAGRAQYGIYPAVRVLLDRLAGHPVVVLAAIMQHSPYALAVQRASGIRNVQDLVGKRVALEKEFRVHEIRRMLMLEGVDPGRVKFITKRWDFNELAAGTADAMAIYSIDMPYDLKQEGMDIFVLRPMDYGVDFYGDVIFTSEKELAAHPQRVRSVRRAVLRGWVYALQHQDEMIQWILDHCPDRPARVTRGRLEYEAREMARLVNRELIEIGSMNPGRWRVQADLLAASDPTLKAAQVAGFLYQPDGSAGLPRWMAWLGWVAAAVAGFSLLGLLEYYRMQRLVQKRTRELRNTEAEFQQLFEQVPVPILVESYTEMEGDLKRLRAEGVTDLRAHLAAHPDLVRDLFSKKRILAANRIALAKVGFSQLEEFNRRLPEVMTQQSMEMFVEELVAIWEERDTLTVEKMYRSTTGRTIHTLLNWQVARKGGHRDLGHARLVFTDLTEQKKAEEELRASVGRYREIFDLSPIALIERDYTPLLAWQQARRAEGVTDLRRYLADHPEMVKEAVNLAPPHDFNEATLKLMRAESKEQLMEVMRSLYAGEVHASRLETIHACWDGLTRVEGEVDLRRMDGVTRRVYYTWHLADPGPEGSTRRALTALVDITDQHVADEALRLSEARYRLLFENAVGGVYRTDLDGHFVSVNPAMARLLGYEDPNELIRRSVTGFAASLYVKPGRREEFLALMAAADRVTNFESEVRTRDGSTVWISEDVRAERDPAGRLLYLDGFVTDITARRRLENEMLRASKLEAVGILAGGIAHDFNNILTVVLGNVTLAEMDTDVSSSVGRMLRDAKQATLRARDLTQQLLTFAKGGDPVRATVALPELVRESAGFAMHGAKARAVYELAADLWPANVDKGQIGQVVQNLVINAVQAMPQGGTVTIRATNVALRQGQGSPLPPGDYIRLTVSDTGVGIPSDHLGKIFDPYFTTKQQGSGLGLATVYSIVRKHQGNIEVESRLGEGTTFTLWLPAAPHGQAEAPVVQPAPVRLQGRVLFMDDEEPIRQMAGLFMERLGLECVMTAEGGEAVREYRAALEAGRPFDLVIMDLTVPGGMGGREAMQVLRAVDPAVRAIVSSGYSRDPVLANYRAHGFSGILPKPYSLDQLQQTLRNIFGPGRTQPPF